MKHKFIYYELAIDKLPDFETKDDTLIGYYFDFRDGPGSDDYLDAVRIVPAFITEAGGTYSNPEEAPDLKSICKGVFEYKGKTSTRIPDVHAHHQLYKRLEGFEEAGGIGFVLLPIGQLRMFARYNTTLYISGCVMDRKTFIDEKNPEGIAGGAGSQGSMFSLKVEGDNVRPKGDKGMFAPTDVRMPFLLGLSCKISWWDTNASEIVSLDSNA